jgi:hypothetical protein
MLGTLKLTRAQVDAVLAALIATGGPFDPAALFAGVAQTLATSGLLTVIGDVTPPTGAAATRHPVTWGTPYVLNDGSAVVDSAPVTFRPAGAETGSVAGIFLADALTAGNLVASAGETPPVPIMASHPYTVVVRLVVDPEARWSVSFSWAG